MKEFLKTQFLYFVTRFWQFIRFLKVLFNFFINLLPWDWNKNKITDINSGSHCGNGYVVHLNTILEITSIKSLKYKQNINLKLRVYSPFKYKQNINLKLRVYSPSKYKQNIYLKLRVYSPFKYKQNINLKLRVYSPFKFKILLRPN